MGPTSLKKRLCLSQVSQSNAKQILGDNDKKSNDELNKSDKLA